MDINQRYRLCRLARNMDQDTVGGIGRVQRRKRSRDRRLPAGFQNAIGALRPVDIGIPDLGQTLDMDARQGQIVRRRRVEDAIDEANAEYLDLLLDLTGDLYLGNSAFELELKDS